MPKPKLKRIPRNELPPPLGEAHDASMALRGDATFFEVFGNHPELYRWYSERFYGEVFSGGRVDRRVKELVRYRLSTLHGCRFCNQGNRPDALSAGVPETALQAIDNGDLQTLTDAERAAVALAERMALTSDNGELDEALYRELSTHFDDAEILELGVVIGVLCGMARFLFTYDLVEKENNCSLNTAVAERESTRR